jgi:2-hydroxychromene-2-carboxylate isomerase/predicted thioesterase
MKPAAPGLRYTGQVMPRPEDLASAIGNKGVHVVSSPATIGYLEMACYAAIAHLIEPDDGTVGVEFQLKHVGAAYPGRPVDVAAELVASDGRLLRFRAEASQDGRPVMTGEHTRALIALSRFIKRQDERPAPRLTFWFDIHSPWCWLAAERIGGLAEKHGADLTWRPLHLPSLIERIGGRRPLEENAAFLAWYKQDLKDHARLLGLDIGYHPHYPLRNSRGLRACIHAIDAGSGEAFVRRLMRAYWSEEADITDIALLARLGAECGLDGAALAAAAQSPKLKERLAANTDEAIWRGIFGVPTIDTGEKLYFGNDRLDLLDRHLTAAASA